jgi:hypothetical protein
MRTFYCPHCGQRIDVELNLLGEPLTWSTDLSPRLEATGAR